MIAFELHDELKMICDTASSFARAQLSDSMRDHEANRQLPEAVHRDYEELGLHILNLPKAVGGLHLGELARVVVNEELAAVDPGAALALDRISLALEVVAKFDGSEAAEALATACLEDPAFYAQLVVVPDDSCSFDGDSLSINIPWVPTKKVDLVVLLNCKGACVIREGIEISTLRGSGLRAASAVEISLKNAPIAMQWKNSEAASKALASVRLYVASLMLGAMRLGCDFSREYALDREVFGKPVAHHQGVAFIIVEMQMALDAARILVRDAASLADRGDDMGQAAAMAFVESVEASKLIGPNAVQLLGGHGFMQDYPMEKVLREVRALGLLAGGVDSAKDDSFSKFDFALAAPFEGKIR